MTYPASSNYGFKPSIKKIENEKNIHFIFSINNDGTDITKEEFLVELKKYLEDTNPKKQFYFTGEIKNKSIFSFLINEQPEQKLMKKIIDTFLDNPKKNDFDEIFYLGISNVKNREYPQKIIFHILDNFKNKEIHKYHKEFSIPMTYLSFFKYAKEDYPLIFNFLNYHKSEILRRPDENEDAIANFLKSNVTPKDWHLFSEYFKEKIGLTDSEMPLFETDMLGVLNLVINHNSIRSNYPNISYEKDTKEMIILITEQINKNKKALGLSNCFCSGLFENNPNTSYLHFISQNNPRPPNKEKIKLFLSSMFNLYSEAFVNNKEINEELLEKMFTFSNINSSNPEKTQTQYYLKRKI